MRRAAFWAGVLALAAVATGSLRWPVSPAWVEGGLNAASGPGRPFVWRAPESATFSALPRPRLRIAEARLDSASGVNLVTAPEAVVDLSLIGLASGRLAPARVTLSAPTITFDLDQPPFVERPHAADAIAAMSALAPLGALSLADGVVRVLSARRGLDAVFEDVRGGLDGLSPDAGLRVNLAALWRDAPVTLSGSLDDPRGAAKGRPSPLNLSVASPLGDLAFRGAVAAGAKPGATGTLSASSRAPGEILRLLGATAAGSLARSLAKADLSVSGAVKASPDDVAFDEATATIDGQTLQGAFRLSRIGDRLAVSGSLDARSLSLTPFLGPVGRLVEPDGGWSRRPFAFAPPRNVDLDLRLSADKLQIYGVGLDDVAASALLKDGALTLNLVEATGYGGKAQGVLQLASDGPVLRLSTRGALEGADFGAMSAGLGWPGWPQVTGKGSGDFALDAYGRSPADMIGALDGKASLALADGALSGVNLEEALRRSQRRPLEIGRDMRSGGTAFEEARLRLLIGSGVAHVVEGALVALALRADAQGFVDLAGETWALRINAAQTEPSGLSPADAARFGLEIDGPWSDPVVRPADETGGAAIGPATAAP